jgi:formylmethanofuran dehydrogenase subunit D
MSIEVVLVSGRTARQGMGLEEGKMSKNYIDSVQLINLNLADAEEIGLKTDETVKVVTEHGSVVVNWKEDKGLDRGLVFLPYGPWANQVIGSETNGTGMPGYKGLKANLESAKGQQVLSLDEIIDLLGGI